MEVTEEFSRTVTEERPKMRNGKWKGGAVEARGRRLSRSSSAGYRNGY